jgi:hypothetical protein
VWFLNIDELALILNIGGMKTKNTTLSEDFTVKSYITKAANPVEANQII